MTQFSLHVPEQRRFWQAAMALCMDRGAFEAAKLADEAVRQYLDRVGMFPIVFPPEKGLKTQEEKEVWQSACCGALQRHVATQAAKDADDAVTEYRERLAMDPYTGELAFHLLEYGFTRSSPEPTEEMDGAPHADPSRLVAGVLSSGSAVRWTRGSTHKLDAPVAEPETAPEAEAEPPAGLEGSDGGEAPPEPETASEVVTIGQVRSYMGRSAGDPIALWEWPGDPPDCAQCGVGGPLADVVDFTGEDLIGASRRPKVDSKRHPLCNKCIFAEVDPWAGSPAPEQAEVAAEEPPIAPFDIVFMEPASVEPLNLLFVDPPEPPSVPSSGPPYRAPLGAPRPDVRWSPQLHDVIAAPVPDPSPEPGALPTVPADPAPRLGHPIESLGQSLLTVLDKTYAFMPGLEQEQEPEPKLPVVIDGRRPKPGARRCQNCAHWGGKYGAGNEFGYCSKVRTSEPGITVQFSETFGCGGFERRFIS